MNRLAEALEMDPVELRQINMLREGSLLSVGTPLPKGVSLSQVVAQAARKAEWPKHGEAPSPVLKRGAGFACAFKNVGFSFGAPEQCMATVELHGGVEIERVVVHHAAAEVGQGTHTVIAQMTAEAAGVPLSKVEMIVSDTATTNDSGSVSASRMTFMAGNAVKGACEQALEKWKMEERPAIAVYQYRPPKTTPYDPQTGKSDPNFAYGYVAQVVEVEVDLESGHVRLVNVISADDVGRAINPQQVQGQIEGAVVQATGYAVLENFVQDKGYVQTQHLSTS